MRSMPSTPRTKRLCEPSETIFGAHLDVRKKFLHADVLSRPHVEDANKLAPTFARIFKEMIIVSDPAKPMARSGKGTVQRKAVISTYADEIEKL